ncbi:hypothetical protein CBR_g53501 [Chara braunii]|uniref:GIY-YIG domain-containing protein n=1 Tax=Chara braunii TaxID=69332 RepID=A0A388MAU0_CHABU|nr:hypothetical protein CBR_g53501 [Chara braunii]|eukprot:GBG91687.1 hypothetical protein CBR_g53501 [Chara braunii]
MGQGAYSQPRRNEEEDRLNRLLLFVESQQLEAAEKKKAELQKKRLEEEKQKQEEAKQRKEAEKRRAQAIMEATTAQAFAKQMVALEEKIKDHVHSTLTASEEKSAKMHDSLRRFLERTEGDVSRGPRSKPYPNPKRRLDLDECERGVNIAERSEVVPITKRRTAVMGKGKEPASAEVKKKGAVASSSRQGVIDFVLGLRESMQTKQAPELKQLCKMKNIRWVSKGQAIKDLVAAETREAYDGWLTGADTRYLWDKLLLYMGLRDNVWGKYGFTKFRICIEQVVIAVFLLLVMGAVAPWVKKVLMVAPTGHDFFDLRGLVVYCLISPWCKRLYIGQAIRAAGERWWEHIRCTEAGNHGHAPKLYSFLKVFGWSKYLVLPIAGGAGESLRVLEKTLIGRFSPALNVVGHGAGTKQSHRPGKKERQKVKGSMPIHRKMLLNFTLVEQGKRYSSLAELLEDRFAAGSKRVEIVSSGGEVWGEKWSIIRRRYGTSTVAVDGMKLSLGRAKQLLERGGKFTVGPVVGTESARSRGKGYLRLLLEIPKKQVELKYFDVTKLVFLDRCAGEFKTKTTRRTLKEKIVAVIRKKTGVNIRLKVNVGVKYSHQLRKRKLHDTVVLCVEKTRVHPVLKTVLRRRVRVVWKKNSTVEQVLANQRKAAREATTVCTSSEDKLPRVDGHVLARVA